MPLFSKKPSAAPGSSKRPKAPGAGGISRPPATPTHSSVKAKPSAGFSLPGRSATLGASPPSDPSSPYDFRGAHQFPNAPATWTAAGCSEELAKWCTSTVVKAPFTFWNWHAPSIYRTPSKLLWPTIQATGNAQKPPKWYATGVAHGYNRRPIASIICRNTN
ncbi:uncharacterized protein BDV14DRAFT_205017 [Aspergillus stella-maris]|uniref:uncharacterized protein n=1 Tax=Aspergillus stella-maris TaxID=1810926 RepID=UPI003CCDE465